MKQVYLAFALILVYVSVGTTSPVADDETRLPFRYPAWWRPSEDIRSYWDPLIARLIWTHPALRRYYKELDGWESSNRETDQPSLLAILNDYEEHEPFMSVTQGRDLSAHERSETSHNHAESLVDEEHPINKRQGPKKEAIDESETVQYSSSTNEVSNSESESTEDTDSESESSESSEETSASEDEDLTADRKRRSDDPGNQLLTRRLGGRSGRRSSDGEESTRITIEQLFKVFGISTERLSEAGISAGADVSSVDVDELKGVICEERNSYSDSARRSRHSMSRPYDEIAPGVLNKLERTRFSGDLIGEGILFRGRPSRSHDGLNSASGDATSRDDGIGKPVPAARKLSKVNLDDVDQILDDLEILTVRVNVRGADPDYTTEETMNNDDDDDDDSDSSLVNAEILTGDTPELRKKRKN